MEVSARQVLQSLKKEFEDKQPEDNDLAVTAEEGIISVNDEAILHEKIDNKN